jgi:hypothetical protein
MERKIVENVSQKWSIFGKTSQNRRFKGKNVFFEKKVWRKFLTSKPPTRKNNGPTTKNKIFQNSRGPKLQVHTTQTPVRRLVVQKQFKTSTHQFSPKFTT